MTDMEKEDKMLPKISLVTIFNQLWERKWRIILIAFISGVIGFLLALDIPKIYRTKVVLAPESSESGLASAASSITSMLGMDLGMSGGDAIYPELYPDIINTIPFTVEMLNIPVSTIDSTYTGDLYHYLTTKQESPWWKDAKYYIKSKLRRKTPGGPDTLDAYRLSKKQLQLIESFHKKVTCEVDVKTSVITLTSVMQDKLVACLVADSLCKKLQEYVTSYKTNKVRGELESVTRMFNEAKTSYLEAQQKYTQFVDRNANLVRESSKAEAVRLENEMNMTFSVYQELSNQVALTRAKLLEQTPAFTVLEPARIAEWHCAPKKSMYAIAFAFLGGIMSCLWFLFRANRQRITAFFKQD